MLIDKIESISSNFMIASNRMYFNQTAPTDPSDSSIWFKPTGLLPKPLTYDAATNNFMSTPNFIDFGVELSTGANTPLDSVIRNYPGDTTAKIKIRRILGFIRNTGAAHNASNYYNFNIRVYYTSGGSPVVYDLFTNTGDTPSALGANGVRRIVEDPEIFINGNVDFIRMLVKRNGSPASILSNFIVYFSYAED